MKIIIIIIILIIIIIVINKYKNRRYVIVAYKINTQKTRHIYKV